jgi:hypothetical protein
MKCPECGNEMQGPLYDGFAGYWMLCTSFMHSCAELVETDEKGNPV